jgi:two-component system, OmpR family, response regulator RegX3
VYPKGGTGHDFAVLVVEDDTTIGRELVHGLARYGMSVRHVVTARDALRQSGDADVVLLDLELPDLDGTEVCRQIRARSAVPIIVLSGRSAESDRVEALGLGADDFLVKPFGLRELVARIDAVRRRTESHGLLAMRVGDLHLDRRSREVTLQERPLQLSPKEFDLLALLMESPGAVLHRKQILDQVWKDEWYGTGRTLDVHITSLRKKFGDPSWIETVRGVGFRLRDPRGSEVR